MNILDENLPKNQRQLLESWRIHIRQIGFNIGRRGMQDEEIILSLLQQRRPTFFSHSEFDTQAKRMGKVVRASSAGISVWRQVRIRV